MPLFQSLTVSCSVCQKVLAALNYVTGADNPLYRSTIEGSNPTWSPNCPDHATATKTFTWEDMTT